jgi:hypothetical protein
VLSAVRRIAHDEFLLAHHKQHHTPPFRTRNHLSFRALPPASVALENPRVGSSPFD